MGSSNQASASQNDGSVPTAKLEVFLLGLKDKERIRVVSFGDEIGVGGYDPNSSPDNKMLHEYLKAAGLSPPPQRKST